MKRRSFSFLMLAVVLLLSLCLLPVKAEAATVASGTCGDNLTWVLDDAGTLTISGTGEMYDYAETYSHYNPAPWVNLWRDIYVVIIENGVTHIGDFSFNGQFNLTNVTIPDSVTSIGQWAFCNCHDLMSINISKYVTSIGDNALSAIEGIWVDPDNPEYRSDKYGVLFNANKTWLYFAPSGLQGEYVVPDNVIKIEDLSFASTNLNTVILPDGLIMIGNNAFACSSIKTITIPKSVSIIDYFAFDHSDLETITFMGDAPTINGYLFPGVKATAYYPSGNSTWTQEVKDRCGGDITWCSYLDKLFNVTISKVQPHSTGNIIYWNAVDCADLYQIYRLNGSKWELLKNTRSLAYKDTTARVGVKHYYKIIARNGDVKSDIKTTVSASAIRPDTKLGNVTIYKTIGHSSGNILYWNAVDGAKLYQVYRLNGTTWELLKNTGSQGYKDETAPKGVACYYKIVARNGDVKSDIRTTTSTRVVRAK